MLSLKGTCRFCILKIAFGARFDRSPSTSFPSTQCIIVIFDYSGVTVTESAPGSDGVKYSLIESLEKGDLQSLIWLLNDRFANHSIPEDWMGSHLASIPTPEKDRTSIQGYIFVTMQNTVGKMLRNIAAKRLASQIENYKLLPSTLGNYRTGKDTRTNAVSDILTTLRRKSRCCCMHLI